MDRIFFENIRCFSTEQSVPLAPLTLLVGENSSGKSTVLALVRLAWDLALKPAHPDFNEEPFQLGAHDQILSAAILKPHRKRSFMLGLEASIWLSGDGDTLVHNYSPRVIGTFAPFQGQPILESWTMNTGQHQLQAFISKEGSVQSATATTPSGKLELNPALGVVRPSDLVYNLVMEELVRRAEPSSRGGQILIGDLRHMHAALSRLGEALGRRPYAFAPVRTKPRRTYDPIQLLESPEGSHVPMILANISRSEPTKWEAIVAAMNDFGRQSGLFERVEVRRLGKLDSDPFQVQVRVGSNAINLLDVGYGVSQVLPIVVDCLRGERGGTFLLQQPEVHLHPKAQAELGSFLGVLAKEQGKRFVIETHSDYLVDRLRMDIRDGKGITSEDVSLLYFERRNGEAHIHRLALDEHGNILDPPPGYRSFFLEEERRFLGG
jgi:predicted ATPase